MSAPRRPASGALPVPGAGRPRPRSPGRRSGVLRRSPREVYRVIDQDELLAQALPEPGSERTPAGASADARARALAPALLGLALAAVAACVVLQMAGAPRRGRLRPLSKGERRGALRQLGASGRTAAPSGSARRAPARRAPARRTGAPAGARRSGRRAHGGVAALRGGARARPRHRPGTPAWTPSGTAPAAAGVGAGQDPEFGFERP